MSTAASKKVVKSAAPAAVATPAPAPVAAAPVEEKKSKKIVAAKVEATPAKAAPAPAPVAAAPAKSEDTATVASTSTAATDSTTLSTVEVYSFESLRTHATELIALGRKVLDEVKQAEKAYARLQKAAEKSTRKRVKRADGAANTTSAFTKPVSISNELASFIGVAAGTQVSRADVSRAVNKYIRDHNLQNPEKRTEINVDAKLSKLVKLGAEDKLTYFNIQKFLKPHFPKTEKTI